MIDLADGITAHKGRKEQYGEAIKGRNSGKYLRYFEIPSPHPSGEPLDMTVDYYSNEDRSVLQITGSWRKWLLGAGTTRDLYYMDVVFCIGAIAQKIGLPYEKVENMNFVKIEVGVGVRYRQNMDGVVDGHVYFKGFDPIYEYRRESVRFKGTAYSVVIYDKWTQLMNLFEQNVRDEEKLARRKGIFPDPNRPSKKRLAKKMNKNNSSIRIEVNVTNLTDCPPEFTDRNRKKKEREIYVRSPKAILKNWNLILDGFSAIYYNIQYCSYNLQVGRNYLDGKGLKELAMFELHLAAIATGGVRNFVQLHLKMLNGNHRNDNIKKRIETLSNPPIELKKALRKCRNKERLLRQGFDERIARMRHVA